MKESILPKPSIGPATTIITPHQAKKFVYFSTQTQGICGRPVKIDPLLLPHFLCLVDPASHQGQAVIRHIEGLRANAGHGDSFQNANRAFDFMDHVGNVRIHYKIMQVDAGEPVGVYITDIRPGFRGDTAKPGLYSVQSSGSLARTSEVQSNVISSAKACINGVSKDLAGAAEQAVHMAKGNAALFYNSANVVNDMGCWFKPSKQEQSAKLAAERLAKVLAETESKSSGKVHWHVQGEGAQLLAKALEKTSVELSKHRFQFFNPVGDTNLLLGTLKKKKAELAESIVDYKASTAAMISLLAQRGALAATIKSLVSQGHPYYQPREKLVSKILGDSAKQSGSFDTAIKAARGGHITFLDTLNQTKGILR